MKKSDGATQQGLKDIQQIQVRKLESTQQNVKLFRNDFMKAFFSKVRFKPFEDRMSFTG